MPTHYAGAADDIRALNAYIKLQRAAESVLQLKHALGGTLELDVGVKGADVIGGAGVVCGHGASVAAILIRF